MRHASTEYVAQFAHAKVERQHGGELRGLLSSDPDRKDPHAKQAQASERHAARLRAER
jgi:hypothetical protein